ncbi:MAG: hypothetical protein K2U26_11460 [Cyclobacteriaceae bacterium]|nr:hypothetical protein [Cyclobacteriaceae bacterium]
MRYNILLPVDVPPLADFPLEDYVQALTHLEPKQFSAFFLHDYVHTKEAPSAHEHQGVEEQLLSKAKRLDVDMKFLSCPGSNLSLKYQSRFADLMMISPVVDENVPELQDLLAEDLLGDMGCPLFLSGDPRGNYEEIIFLFDHNPAGPATLKSFFNLFGQVSSKKKVTIMMPTGPDYFFEAPLVRYAQSIFDNVGLLPVNTLSLEKGLVSFAAKADRPLLIMGHSARKAIDKKALIEMLASNKLSMFISQ